MSSRPFQKPPTQVEAVLSELRRALLEGDYPAGSRLNVDGISKTLGVSRAPVRDALRILEGEQQVIYEPHRGYCVPEMRLEDLFDLYRIRELLESEAAALAVPTLTPADIAGLRASAEVVTRALAEGNRVTATYANRELHFRLFESPGHEQLVTSIRQAWNADAYRALYLRDLDSAAASASEHDAIVDAAAEGDVARVVLLQNAHRDGELKALLRMLADRFPGAQELSANRWRAMAGAGRTVETT
ncbi:GntR family transcriptional regulator [Micromonospora sp. HNM0581]|uniref:GntR family transcriptional regulator n=1 Tax=Micromonospora sp. HNM0581 TaxID=2716341 RepID=UPI00146C0B85|nr:GntR family transcriptional regulator [Micromonospora sp. HNM0581]NLU78494.1 GntR family transcriptional regulator [Micromonospora sp. HNM0581]